MISQSFPRDVTISRSNGVWVVMNGIPNVEIKSSDNLFVKYATTAMERVASHS